MKDQLDRAAEGVRKGRAPLRLFERPDVLLVGTEQGDTVQGGTVQGGTVQGDTLQHRIKLPERFEERADPAEGGILLSIEDSTEQKGPARIFLGIPGKEDSSVVMSSAPGGLQVDKLSELEDILGGGGQRHRAAAPMKLAVVQGDPRKEEARGPWKKGEDLVDATLVVPMSLHSSPVSEPESRKALKEELPEPRIRPARATAPPLGFPNMEADPEAATSDLPPSLPPGRFSGPTLEAASDAGIRPPLSKMVKIASNRIQEPTAAKPIQIAGYTPEKAGPEKAGPAKITPEKVIPAKASPEALLVEEGGGSGMLVLAGILLILVVVLGGGLGMMISNPKLVNSWLQQPGEPAPVATADPTPKEEALPKLITGQLRIWSDQKAKIWVDGQLQGTVSGRGRDAGPLGGPSDLAPLSLIPGTHIVRAQNSAGKIRTVEVRIDESRPTDLVVRFAR